MNKFMMKRILGVLLVISLLSGCAAPSSGVQGEIVYDTAYEMYDNKLSTFAEEHYVSEGISIDYGKAALDYVNAVTLDTLFKTYYLKSEKIEIYPVYGTYLEQTDLAVYVFYEAEQPSGIGQLQFDSQGNVISASIREIPLSSSEFVQSLSLEQCFESIKSCKENHPDFEIIGLVYCSEGLPVIYPVGKNPGDDTIYYVDVEPTEFKLVDAFTSIEAGRSAFSAYLSDREAKLKNLIIFPWENETLTWFGYIGGLNANDEREYLNDYDNYIVIPLLSSTGEENVYVLHLLYYHSQLIAEVVVKRDSEDLNIVWENVAEKNSDGSYVSLECSQYESLVNGGINTRNILNQHVSGVMFTDKLKLVWSW